MDLIGKRVVITRGMYKDIKGKVIGKSKLVRNAFNIRTDEGVTIIITEDSVREDND